MALYIIAATVTVESRDGWRTAYQMPSFYLDSRIQGIVDDAHAERIARTMLMQGRNPQTTAVSVSAGRLWGET